MYTFLIVVLAILYVVGFMRHKSKKFMRAAISNIPGPYCVPLLGCLHELYKLNYKNVLWKTDEFVRNYGNIVRLWAFNRLMVASADFELNEQLLASNVHITKHRNYGILHQWLGVGLLVSDGKKWHSRRKIITPAFHFKILEDFLEVFDRQSSVLIDCLAERADGKTAFDIYPYMCLLTLDVIMETAMGTKVNAQTDKTVEYTAAVNEMTTLMAWRFLRTHLNNEIVFTLLHPQKKWRQMKLVRNMHEFTRKVIEKRRKTLGDKLSRDDAATHDDDHGHDTKKRMALLDVLLQATIDGKPLTDEDIRAEVDTFMFAGHDTTASALSFTLYLLARHPQVQNKLLDEIRQVYGDDGSTPFTLMNLNELKYMECVIKESLRLYPSVPILAREIVDNFYYKHSRLGDGVIPAGTEFMIAVFTMMRDPTRFEDSLAFRPERFERSRDNSIFNVTPFSAGPRNCIGQKFAMYEMKVILSEMIRRYELLPMGDDVEPVLNIVLRSDTGMQLGITNRTTY